MSYCVLREYMRTANLNLLTSCPKRTVFLSRSKQKKHISIRRISKFYKKYQLNLPFNFSCRLNFRNSWHIGNFGNLSDTGNIRNYGIRGSPSNWKRIPPSPSSSGECFHHYLAGNRLRVLWNCLCCRLFRN